MEDIFTRIAARFGVLAEDATTLVAAMLAERDYDVGLVARARALACDRNSAWELRRLAALVLEHQFFRAVASEIPLLDPLADIGVIDRDDDGFRLGERGLLGACGSTEPSVVAANLAHRVRRVERIHRGVNGANTTIADLDAFLHRSQQECRLLLGRYLLPPADVVARVCALLRASPGGRGWPRGQHLRDDHEAQGELARMPLYEATICRLLRDRGVTYWVADDTPSAHFGLIEYPLGAVVAVVKPPGSEFELEIKRVGLRGAQPLTARWQRDGRALPIPHRLQGGSTIDALSWEASHSLLLTKMYRLTHGSDAPISRTLALAPVASVPAAGDVHSLSEYFSRRDAFGEGFAAMRRELRFCIEAYCEEQGGGPPPAADAIEETAQFLSRARPAQAILGNTTSLRLDRLSADLGEGGADKYFERLGCASGYREARRFGDDLLEEVLDSYSPPQIHCGSYEGYIDAALASAANRPRADRCFLSLHRQIGEFWGTLAALRGASRGESFVARNVGLRRIWRDGDWRVEIRFMDHDGLDLAGRRRDQIHPRRNLRSMAQDAGHIFGDRDKPGELGHLAQIYRVSSRLAADGRRELKRVARDAYRTAITAMRSRPELRDLHRVAFVESLLDLDEVVAIYRRGGGAAWEQSVEEHLLAKGRMLRIAADYRLALREQHEFLDDHGDLFLTPAEMRSPGLHRAGTDSESARASAGFRPADGF